MPAIRGVAITPTEVTITKPNGSTRVLTAASIPGGVTIPQAETFANNWLAANMPEIVGAVHIFSLSPLHWTLFCGNLGTSVPPNWWEIGGTS